MTPRELNSSKYILTIRSKRNFICLALGSVHGKRVSWGGGEATIQRQWSSESFWGSVLKMFFSTESKFSDIICSKSNFGCNDHPWEDDDSIYVYIYIYTTIILPGTLTVVYIYRRSEKKFTFTE